MNVDCLEEYGPFTKSEWRILRTLNKDDETFTGLVEKTSLSKPVISRASNDLMEKGLITKERSEEDKRVRIYRITEKGNDRYEEVRERVIDDLKKVKERVERILEETEGNKMEQAAEIKNYTQSLFSESLRETEGVKR
ncbi:MAG: Transcriptional regulator, MarR family [Candidatus Methanohalarchaeum thermophilum]|uniref:Transcriptional regulator, MarR family n=1 Tax=Methanohalarchaeum thermophilum TaxID=1903181 RepID=A0A1Q6DUW5_METT1|nr:MAG: Transcriptional regulator, MarR family [Candidatus Methanohalarchaeum thermophilum]